MTPQKLNEWRIVPRALVLLYGLMCYQVAEWFMSIPDPSSQQAAFVSIVLGSSAAWFGLYVNSGTKSD